MIILIAGIVDMIVVYKKYLENSVFIEYAFSFVKKILAKFHLCNIIDNVGEKDE